MGIIIFTADDKDFLEGNPIIMERTMQYPPTADNRTYILRNPKQFNEIDVLEWSPSISYRLVVVVDKLPRLTSKSEDLVIIHPSLERKKESFYRNAVALLRWKDRERCSYSGPKSCCLWIRDPLCHLTF